MIRSKAFYGNAIIVCLLLCLMATSVFGAEEKCAEPEQRGVIVVPAGAATERRTALVIGNAAYTEGPLNNPVHDAKDTATALQEMGFQVNIVCNAALQTMDEALDKFSKELRQGGIGLFYFAGHGLQVQGENFLVPLGARIAREQDVKYAAMPVGRVLGAMEDAGNNLNIIILDACRNNPFVRSFRSSQAGLAQVQAATGFLIAYATAPGSVAEDGTERNGVYTAHLLQNIRLPGVPVEQVFKNVRLGVMADTKGKQTPWELSSLTGSLTFVPSAGGSPAPAAQLLSPAPVQPSPVVPESSSRQESAKAELRKPELVPQNIEAKQRFQQGMSFVSTGRIDAAIQEFSAAIELDPTYATAYGNRGVAYIQQKKYNKAQEDLKQAVKLDPNDRAALYNLVVVHTLQKDLDLALDVLDKTLDKGFNNYDALRNDRDLVALRKHPEFRKILERHKVSFILNEKK